MEGHTGATTEYQMEFIITTTVRTSIGLWILCIKSRKLLWHKGTFTFKIVILICAVLTTNCNKRRRRAVCLRLYSYSYCNSKDTILITNANLKLNNGIYFFSKPYSGYIKEIWTKLNAFFLNGQQQGLSLVYFVDGKLKNLSYKDGRSYGRHFDIGITESKIWFYLCGWPKRRDLQNNGMKVAYSF
jgi:hypothetical protein